MPDRHGDMPCTIEEHNVLLFFVLMASPNPFSSLSTCYSRVQLVLQSIPSAESEDAFGGRLSLAPDLEDVVQIHSQFFQLRCRHSCGFGLHGL